MEQELPEVVKKYITEVASKYSKKPISIKPKSSSKLMKAVAWFFKAIKINPMFMDYYTTIGNTIYYPDKTDLNSNGFLEVISHECIHIKDANAVGPLFKILYLAPQILALLSLLSFVAIFASKLWLLNLLFLVFLAPIPAYFRYYFEKRAYRTSFIFGKFLYGYSDYDLEKVRDQITEQLSKSFYYFAWPFPKMIKRELSDMRFLQFDEYKEIIAFVEKMKNP